MIDVHQNDYHLLVMEMTENVVENKVEEEGEGEGEMVKEVVKGKGPKVEKREDREEEGVMTRGIQEFERSERKEEIEEEEEKEVTEKEAEKRTITKRKIKGRGR